MIESLYRTMRTDPRVRGACRRPRQRERDRRRDDEYVGEEAVATGVCAALRADDVVTSTTAATAPDRERRGYPADEARSCSGGSTGSTGGAAASMHAADFGVGVLGANGIVGGAPVHPAGAAWARQQAGTN